MGDQELSAPPPPPPDAELTSEQKLYWLNALQIVGDWTVHDDGDGRLFYYDRRTDSSQWEVPDALASLETEFMMKLMLQNAVARSGVWTAHDAGNGTLYYFNSKTRVSVWQRPSEWGEQEAAAAAEAREREAMADLEREKKEKEKQEQEADRAAKKVKKEKKRHKKQKKQKEERGDEAGAEEKGDGKEGKREVPTPLEEVEEEEPLTAEEMQEEKERKAREQKRMEQFRAMLRDKNIMPFCKWSVALPQIAGDPRFMGVPTMDERRAIFEHFVEHRREDLKAEKKSKLKQAKQVFTQLLKEQFQLDSWGPKTTLSVFISTLEDQLQPDRYKQVQEDALALLTLSAQEKIYAKAVADYKSEALKRDGEQLRLTKFLEDKLATHDTSNVRWESDEVQKFVQEFYSSAESAALLPAQKQQQVFEELVARTSRGREPSRDKRENKRPERPRSPPRDRVSSNNDHKRQDPSPRRKSRHSHHDRHRSRSRSRRSRSRSNSRSRSRGRDRGHRSRGRSHRRSASSSRSRSHSQERSSRRSSSRYHRHHSPSSSRSRSRTRR